MAGFKSIRITKPCKLSIKNSNLLIKFKDDEYRFYLPDIDTIVFEGNQFSLTAVAIDAFAKHKIAVLFCDKYYMPSSILLPYNQYSLSLNILEEQINLTKEFKANLWQLIIEAKILNQIEVCDYLKLNTAKLISYKNSVRENDKYKAEAKSARVYWKLIFKNLKREQDSFDIRNQALNYAYAICRSMIARDLSASGFQPALGIWHNNKLNAFNLADDLIEPFRPLIDIAIKKLLTKYNEDVITSTIKKEIILLFDKEYIKYKNGISSLRKVTNLFVVDFKRVILSKKLQNLEFPTLHKDKLDECF